MKSELILKRYDDKNWSSDKFHGPWHDSGVWNIVLMRTQFPRI